MITASEIESLSVSERLRVMEKLWRSLAATPDAVKSPAWHGEVLRKRREKIESGKAVFLTLEQMKKRLARRKT